MATTIKTPVVIGEDSTQILVLSDTIVFKIPVSGVIDEKFDIKINDCKVCPDTVVFNGTVKKDIIYKEPSNAFNEGGVRYHEESYNFGGIFEIKGVQEGDTCHIEKTDAVKANYFIPQTYDNSGNILTATQKFIVDISIKVTREQQIQV
ncbi:hypothetical protein Dtox_1753 [Desulfofarcimen acetoxidans DSM 771]|jgi:hypothetical protein|uniref:SipL SPOCS domain-containing protein n=1 Tax=Desulfofarcimen acetoxidans (strain ATCC 49208 / DSM 771 / KCTC 5769 / VKM B-1644 / 5575) TaxID=485916 RepID=C8VX34_DESAS|nr:DUF3794 domain-containing protein [Desulfofarcimen acetoxidans]ACV62610.1 hypothetical protein Dtox_1753 [Desulfofarcimen acetoxidans DSM 771]